MGGGSVYRDLGTTSEKNAQRRRHVSRGGSVVSVRVYGCMCACANAATKIYTDRVKQIRTAPYEMRRPASLISLLHELQELISK